MSDRKPLFARASGPVAVGVALAILAVATAAAYKRRGRRDSGDRPSTASTLDLSAARLQVLAADEFRDICKAYYYSRQFRLRGARVSGDARDALLYFGTLPYPVAIVRIMAPAAKPIEEDSIRDLPDVMALHAVAKGIVHAPGGYTDAAIAYARGNRIRLVSGEELVRNISGMPDGARTAMANILIPAPAHATQ